VLERERTEGAQVRTAVPDDLAVVADPELLARALANVVRNAVRYAGSAGPIDITARREQDEVIIEVCDSGVGVPAESLFQLFEPFYRPEASRGRDSGGVGLGLAIVKTCIQTCHGAVSARNLKPHGFCVAIVLSAIP
jgi:two-component system sensor histidine kinase CpxA